MLNIVLISSICLQIDIHNFMASYIRKMNNSIINQKIIDTSISFEEYYSLSEKLVNEGKTSGADQSEILIDFTKLNFQRLKRNVKTNVLKEGLTDIVNKIDRRQTWLILVECWCGDVAQNLPVINKMVELNPLIDLKIILRDENLPIIDAYLTNGGRSIPKLVILDEQLNEITTWGPRPAYMQQMVMDYMQKENKEPFTEFAVKVHKWYAKNKTEDIQQEFIALLGKIF